MQQITKCDIPHGNTCTVLVDIWLHVTEKFFHLYYKWKKNTSVIWLKSETDDISTTTIQGAPMLKFNSATWLFLKYDIQHDIKWQMIILKINKRQYKFLNLTKQHCCFLKLTLDITLVLKVTNQHRKNLPPSTPLRTPNTCIPGPTCTHTKKYCLICNCLTETNIQTTCVTAPPQKTANKENARKSGNPKLG